MFHLMLPLADVGSALTGIAKMFAGYLAGGLAFALVIAGYTYMFALDDHSKAMQAKRAIGVAIGGAIVIAVAVGIALKITQTIGH
jgi:hypothetical protein